MNRKIRRLFFRITILLLILSSCNSTNLDNHVKINDSTKVSNADFAKVDTTLILQYRHRLDSAKGREKDFINYLLSILTQYQGKRLDTTILTVGLIDSDTRVDTIQTRVFLKHDTIWVNSIWIKDNKINWEYSFNNPYLFISDFIYRFYEKDIWIPFTIGIYFAPPILHNTNEYKNLFETAVTYGLEDLKKNGISVNESDYKKYLLNFKGNLIEWGNPTIREGLHIWYEPSNRFVIYYQP